MKIELNEIAIKDLIKDYKNESINENGIIGYHGLLDIRPKYQREFVYKEYQQQSVINTILSGYPLNVMYWVRKPDLLNNFEVLDGQQRTISICEYAINSYPVMIDGKPIFFNGLPIDLKDRILNYKLMVYFCEGEETEKLNWFKTINISGEKLTEQELRNSVYTGKWLSDAKLKFSKTNCIASQLGNDYVKGAPIRQELFETALKWISDNHIEKYMAMHQNDENASELWQYYQKVISWVKITFPEYRKDLKGLAWGELYNKYKDIYFDSQLLETKYLELIQDDEIESKNTKGIYLYLITNEEKHLNLRSFNDKHKTIAYNKQNGVCVKCGGNFDIKDMEGDHIIPWSKGGKTTQENCQMLCKKCNGIKSNN